MANKRTYYAGTNAARAKEYGLSKSDLKHNREVAKAWRDLPDSEETTLRNRLYTEAEKTAPRLTDGRSAGLGVEGLGKINKLSISEMRKQVAKLDSVSTRTPASRRDGGDDERGEDSDRRAKPMTKSQIKSFNDKMRADGHRRFPKSSFPESPEYTKNRLAEEAQIKAGTSKVGKKQNSDAQTKTARLSRKGKWKEAQGGKGRSGVAKIAKSMQDRGKTGWVTINGAKINLG